MRTLIVTAFMSLDGVVEAPGGEPGYRNSGWTFKAVDFVPEAYELKGTEQEETTALLLGRVSYEAFAPVWPKMEEFATYNAMPKYVVSTTLEAKTVEQAEHSWGEVHILRSLDDVAALKETEGGPIAVHGSATLARTLADAGLVDRYHLLVFPLLLGAGKRLFSDADKDAQKLRLVDHAAYSNGIQKQVFEFIR
ncbi:deaminase [Nocardioides gansuensis]|uniref:Deaminase n=1 Tax=Nocardioides gansuensis TaxID=2138300 RepID=A0A2T8F6R8_9ACTN|nr:dihydrofolate reductase family protein [Nocardioides gansuensis]PVG81411.1 deaminase [Nocardioides gansuensis]